MLAPVRLAVLVTVVFAAVSGAAYAEQREARLLKGPFSERPATLVACTTDQQLKWKQCVDGARAGCMLLADQSQRRGCVEKINATCSGQLGVQC